ncbi:hypothetical protein MferCBS31731_002679 [Microsporum ferrugineum]
MGDPGGSSKANPVDEVRDEVNEGMPRVPRVVVERHSVVQGSLTVARGPAGSRGLTVADLDVIPLVDLGGDDVEPVRPGTVQTLNLDPLLVEHSDVVPGLEVVERSRRIALLNGAGERRLFGELLDELRTLRAKKILVIFIRHFFCGRCQDYVEALAKLFPNPRQDLPNLTNLVIIGCGAHTLIDEYRKTTNCPFTIYAEPTGKLVKLFGMKRNLIVGKDAPTFSERTGWSLTWQGIKLGLSRIFKGDAFKAGNPMQNGGEILFEFEQPPNGRGILAVRATWCHIMKTTRDHAPINVIQRALGVQSQ